jgi:hypothetical protein
MKRTLLIIGGLAIILLLVGIWMYILFTGTTSETVSFADFDLGDTTDPTVMPIENEPSTNSADLEEKPIERLRQLTTTPVAGFTQTTADDSAIPVVRYVESGTGHIYEINLATEESKRISATTIPLTYRAAITPDGSHMFIQSDTGPRASFTIGTISSSSDRLTNYALDEAVVSFTATDENEFLFATAGERVGQLQVKKLNPDTGDIKTLFTIPFMDATIAWHHTIAGPHIVYPKTTRWLEGYVYSYTNGAVQRINATGYGLSAVGSTDSLIYSKVVDDVYQTFSMNTSKLVSDQTPLTFIPEKCSFTHSRSSVAICGADFADPTSTMPDSWYRGNTTANDVLWEYNLNTQSAQLLVSPEKNTGRQIDLINPQFSPNDTNFFFQNKNDGTLWVYSYIITNADSN